MGTSIKYGGPKSSNPLVPSWLNEPNSDEGKKQNEIPMRFKGFRQNFNSYAKTGNGSSLRKSMSNYVSKTSGGAKSASQRMSSSKATAEHILGFVNNVRSYGFDGALAELGLSKLVGRDSQVVFSELTEVFCPKGGPIDDSIARSAWDKTILDVYDNGIYDVTNLNIEQWQSLFKDFVTNSIVERIYNDIGKSGINLPENVERINEIQNDLCTLVRGAVDDAIGGKLEKSNSITQGEIKSTVDEIYEKAFDYLGAMEE